MKTQNLNLSDLDKELIDQAVQVIQKRFRPDHHHIGAALRTKSGQTFTGLHVEAYIGRVTICAEAVAIRNAMTIADHEIDTIVAVTENGQIVAPCGICRELIADYGSNANVIIKQKEGIKKVKIRDLLPNKYER